MTTRLDICLASYLDLHLPFIRKTISFKLAEVNAEGTNNALPWFIVKCYGDVKASNQEAIDRRVLSSLNQIDLQRVVEETTFLPTVKSLI